MVTSTVALFWCFPGLFILCYPGSRVLTHPPKILKKRKEKRLQSLAECADRECLTCAQRRGSDGGGGWYWQALFAVLIFAFIASFAFAHRVMGGVTA